MNKIHKIITARNTAFIENFPMDTAEKSPIVTDIFFWYTETSASYRVDFSNGTYVEVKDVVEIWNRPATSEEEEKIKDDFAKMPLGE